MSIEIKVPTLPESVSDATVAKWYKQVGEFIARDENLVDLETDKVMLEVPAPQSGVIKKIIAIEGATVAADAVLAIIEEGEGDAKTSGSAADEGKAAKQAVNISATKVEKSPAAMTAAVELSPAVRRLVAEHQVDVTSVAGSGKGGRITKEDVEKHLQTEQAAQKSAAPETRIPAIAEMGADRIEKRVPMTRLRARIAERLVQAQHDAAILTTFNEVNMQPVMDLRQRYKDTFEKTHKVRLGFMSFFTKAATEALKRFPIVNASVDDKDIIYHSYCDIGIAVGGGPRGLVVPVIRNAEKLSMANIEKTIREYADKAMNGKLTIEEMTGGTFTITNGGTYGSMMSTPIINPPQSAILGMHKIMERAMVEDGKVVIRPMMYLALSYDHRIVDGSDSVQFLVTIKELLEDPARLLLEI